MRKTSLLLFLALFPAGAAMADPIHRAVREDDLAKVRDLIAKDPRVVSAVEDDKQTPLHIAVRLDHQTAISQLTTMPRSCITRPEAAPWSLQRSCWTKALR